MATPTPTFYTLIHKVTGAARHFDTPHDVSIFLLGMVCSNFTVVKHDHDGARIITFNAYDVVSIVAQLTVA